MESCSSVRRKEENFERIMYGGYDWDHRVRGDAVEGLVKCVSTV